jgi:hypothetical protein
VVEEVVEGVEDLHSEEEAVVEEDFEEDLELRILHEEEGEFCSVYQHC